MDLEVCGASTLKDLDHYLRQVWLECCGHMSRFSVGGWQGKEIQFSRRISDAFATNIELTHIYDFGTSSETHPTITMASRCAWRIRHVWACAAIMARRKHLTDWVGIRTRAPNPCFRPTLLRCATQGG